ncbi:MMPL family transporter [Actinomadura rubrisoli]|uniref:MMPL family transporter n=1 Tax=Actinomadura rubrisoli TaxID=2530368 RepID=A0A4R5A1M7_9ACTN|nr:MMPL family transporter [Actinomadura rubrisoli]TDD65663.1 MMPL family transporter [Actinomadura rubrisoli]
MERLLERLGRTTARHPLITIVSWLLAAVALLAVSQAAGGAFVNEFRIPGAESQHAVDLAQRHFPQYGAVSADAVWHTGSGTLKDPRKAAAIKAVVGEFARQPDVRSADDPLAGMVSADGTTALSSIQYGKELGDLSAAHADRLDKAAEAARKAGVDVEFRGLAVDLASQPETSAVELIGVAAALIILLIAFGSVVAAGLPVLVALMGLMAGTALVLIAGTAMDIPAIAPIVAVMLGLGAGVDYALFVLTRFRHYLALGEPKVDAVGHALATAGHAVLFAGATVVVAILGLLLTGVPFIGGMGVAAALTVTMTMTAALTLFPAVLGLLGPKVNALRVGRRRTVAAPLAGEPGVEPGLWGRWAQRVAARRYLYAGLAVLILAVLSLPLLGMRLGTPDDGNNPQSFTQRRAYDIVADKFGPGWNAPFLVVAEAGDKAGNDAMVKRLTAGLTADREVSVVTPPQASADGKVSLLTVVPKHSPQDQEVSDLLHRVRDDLVPKTAGRDATIAVGGPTAFVTDLSDTIGDRLPWMVLAVLVAAAVLLVAMFRAPLVALQAALMALLSIGAAFGVLIAVFQWGWGVTLLGVDGPVPIMSMVPMLLFAVLFGLSMDYEVFLLSAIKEEYDASHDAQRATWVGVDGTARVITAAGAIMTVVFLSFVPISDVAIKMIGIGLAAAVLVDVTVVRLMLAPAVMSILGDAAWRGSGGRRPDRAAPAPPAREPSDVG